MDSYTYKYAVIVGIDGMGNFNSKTSTPRMDEIFADGASTHYAMSMFPTISAQNWGSMLLGVDPEVHNMTNGSVSLYEHNDASMPSLFTVLRKAFPDSFLCSCCNWDPINHGIIEHDIGVEMHTGDDETLCGVIEECVSRKPKFLFIQFDSVDGAGHTFGYGEEGHLKQITRADELTGRVYDAYKKAGILEDTLFTVIADHGGYIKGHGSYSDGEKYIYLAAAGKNIVKSSIPYAQAKDINAIILHGFGLDVPEYRELGYSAQIPQGIFPDTGNIYIKPEPKPYLIPTEPTPLPDADDGILSYFPKEKFKLAMFFDNSAEDEFGKVSFNLNGRVKYYSSGRYGAMGELGQIGWLSTDDVKFGKDSFTISAWLKVDKNIDDNCYICGTKEVRTDSRGFMLVLTSGGTMLQLEGDDHSSYTELATAFVNEISEGWVHTVISFNREEMKVDIYHNFRHKRSIPLEDMYDVSMDNKPFTVGNECSFKGNNIYNNNIFNIDDLFVFNGAMSEEDVSKLAMYYKIG